MDLKIAHDFPSRLLLEWPIQGLAMSRTGGRPCDVTSSRYPMSYGLIDDSIRLMVREVLDTRSAGMNNQDDIQRQRRTKRAPTKCCTVISAAENKQHAHEDLMERTQSAAGDTDISPPWSHSS